MAIKKRRRPKKLSEDVGRRLIRAARRGNYKQAACALVGISDTALEDWLKIGEEILARAEETTELNEVDELYAWFAYEFRRAESKVEDESVNALRTGRDSQNRVTIRRGHKDFLGRRFPGRWGSRKALEISGEMDLNHTAKVVLLPPLEQDDIPGNTMETQSGAPNAIPGK